MFIKTPNSWVAKSFMSHTFFVKFLGFKHASQENYFNISASYFQTNLNTRAVRHRVEVSAPVFVFVSRLTAHALLCKISLSLYLNSACPKQDGGWTRYFITCQLFLVKAKKFENS